MSPRIARIAAPCALLSLAQCAHGSLAREDRPWVGPRAGRVEWIAAIDPALAIQEGQRFARRSGQWTAIDGRMAAPIVAVSRVGDDWLFASEDGVIARSRGALGPLERLVELPMRLRAQPSSTVPAAPDTRWSVVDRREDRSSGVLIALASPPDRSMRLIDARGAVRAVSFSHSVVRARFASATLGLVELEDQSLRCTSDGGARWTVIERASPAPIEAIRAEGSALIVTDSDRWRVDERCAVTANAALPRGPAIDPRADSIAVHSAMASDDPHSIGAWWSAQSARYWIERSELVVRDARDGRRSVYGLASTQCAAMPFGDALIVPCAARGPQRRLTFSLLDARGSALRPWLSLRGTSAEGTMVVDPRGAYVLTAAPCDSSDRVGPRRLCRVERDGARRTIELESAIESVIGAWGSLVLAWRATERSRERFAFDPGTGATVAIPAWLAARDTELARSTLGTVTALTEARALWVGDSLQTLRAIAMPRGAVGAGFIDASRGVAFGATSDVMFVTGDGGARWSAVSTRIDGAPSAYRTHSYIDDALRPRVAACAEDQCAIGDRLLARWPHEREGDSRSTAAPLARSTSALAATQREIDPWLTHSIHPYYDGARFCAARSESFEQPAPGERERSMVLSVGLTLRCRVGSSRWSCVFEGERVGDHGVRASERFELAMADGDVDAAERGFRLVASSDQGVVLESNTRDRPRMVVIGRALRPWWIAALDGEAPAFARSSVRVSGLSNDASWWLAGDSAWTAYNAEHGRARGVVLVEHRADQTVGRVSRFIASQAIVRGWLAVRGGRVGWMAPSQTPDALLFWAADAQEPERLPALFAAPLAPCSASEPRAPSDTVILRELNASRVVHSPLGTAPIVYVRASGASACIERALQTPWQTLDRGWGAAQEWRASGGQWRAFSQSNARESIASASCGP